METNIEAINQIPFEQVFIKLWIKTYPKWFWTKWIFDNGKKTDWWVYNEKENMVNDFSGKRAKWDVIKFIQEYLKTDFQWAIRYCEQNFNINNIQKMETVTRKPFKKIEELNESGNISRYLKLRWINYQKLIMIVKPSKKKTYGKDVSYDWECIACEMKNIKGDIMWVQYRSIQWKAFHTDWSDGLFYSFTSNIKKDKLFIVEWLTDYLSLRQYTPQVIWFKSCKTAIDEDFKKFAEKFDKIYLLFDNDDAGKEAKDRFKEKITWTKILEIIWDTKIDVNDLAMQLWEDLIDWIENYSETTQTPAFSNINCEERSERWIKEWENTNPDTAISWWWEEFDKKLGYLQWWQLILIWWSTWTWKSTLVNQICTNVSLQGFNVARYSLEDRIEDRVKEEYYYLIWRIRKQNWLSQYPWSEFERNNIKSNTLKQEMEQAKEIYMKQSKNIIDLDSKKLVNIMDLEMLMEKEVKKWCKLFCIDHLHYFDMDSNEKRHDLIIQGVMHKINEIARKNNIVIILIAHYKKIGKSKPTNDDFKDWVSISQVANKIIHIYRDIDLWPNQEWWFETSFIISKNRSPNWTWEIVWYFDTKTYEYSFKQSFEQIKRESISL